MTHADIPQFAKPVTSVLPTDDADTLMAPVEVARYLKVNIRSVYYWTWDGRLPAVRIGRNVIRIRKGDVDALLTPRTRPE